MTVKTLKRIERTVHIIGAIVLMVFVYSNLIDEAGWRAAIRFAVLPILTLSGFAIWQAPRIVRRLRASS